MRNDYFDFSQVSSNSTAHNLFQISLCLDRSADLYYNKIML